MNVNGVTRENDYITIWGTVDSTFNFSHESFGEKFYIFHVKCNRLSGAADVLPIMVSDRTVDVSEDRRGESVYIAGDIRTRNMLADDRSHLIVFVFASEIEFMRDVSVDNQSCYIKGCICRPTVYRVTPNGREIGEMLVAVNRAYGKSDYIPCICWGRTARYIDHLEPGNAIEFDGRLQSRNYIKRSPDGGAVERTAYEVSIKTLKLIEEEK